MIFRRRRMSWCNLPSFIYADADRSIDIVPILKGWGFRTFSNGTSGAATFSAENGEYEGWQDIDLPYGWTISLERHQCFLVDQHDQSRGEIEGFFANFKRREKRRDFLGLGAAIGKAMQEGYPEGESPLDKIMRMPIPRLYLYRCLRPSYSFTFGGGDSNRTFYTVENAFGEIIFSAHARTEDGCTKARETRDNWLETNFPDWRNHLSYWDHFISEKVEAEVHVFD